MYFCLCIFSVVSLSIFVCLYLCLCLCVSVSDYLSLSLFAVFVPAHFSLSRLPAVLYTSAGSDWRRFGFPRKRRPLNSVILDGEKAGTECLYTHSPHTSLSLLSLSRSSLSSLYHPLHLILFLPFLSLSGRQHLGRFAEISGECQVVPGPRQVTFACTPLRVPALCNFLCVCTCVYVCVCLCLCLFVCTCVVRVGRMPCAFVMMQKGCVLMFLTFCTPHTKGYQREQRRCGCCGNKNGDVIRRSSEGNSHRLQLSLHTMYLSVYQCIIYPSLTFFLRIGEPRFYVYVNKKSVGAQSNSFGM